MTRDHIDPSGMTQRPRNLTAYGFAADRRGTRHFSVLATSFHEAFKTALSVAPNALSSPACMSLPGVYSHALRPTPEVQ